MTLPDPIRGAVGQALAARTGSDGRVLEAVPVGGGCISPVARLTTAEGRFFLKWSTPGHPEGLLAAEARGLRRLASTRTVRVPEVVATHVDDGAETVGDPARAPAWLLLEWLEPGHSGEMGWQHLGRDLASLHRHRGERFGADANNFIGTLRQANHPERSWSDFWRSRRLEPQLRIARDNGHFSAGDAARFDRLLSGLDDRLDAGDTDGASVLHGDLWNGNVHFTADGSPALVDPSVYHGHREVDLAMAELFGGFGAAFREAYEDAWPLSDGYAPVRRAVYQLYYLLVHVNLFGAGYVGGCRAALTEAGV